MNKMKGNLPLEHIADAIYHELHRGALDRWTYCALVMSIRWEIDVHYDQDPSHGENFLEACHYYELADHDTMEGFPYTRTKETE